MSSCHVQRSGGVELYFYGELAGAERDGVERHLAGCDECRRALEELSVIRAALELRPDVAAPPGGDWSGFMARLEAAVGAEAVAPGISAARAAAFRPRRTVAAALAMAALVTLVTLGVLLVLRDRGARVPGVVPPGSEPTASASEPALVPVAADSALALASEQHFERSKLVLLGLSTKDAAHSSPADWDYERTLATALLNDTRLYRQMAEARGMKTLAGVMRDLELVLLQTSMSEAPDAESLAQLQRLIQRRDLLTKMNLVAGL